MSEEFFDSLDQHFPTFAAKLRQDSDAEVENVELGATSEELADIEESVGVLLPDSYKKLLSCAREFELFGGAIQFGFQHPFIHEFDSDDKSDFPSEGMLCFAEFFMEADGDQVLFDIKSGLTDGEYPVMYYSHESSPPAVRKLADDLETFLNEFLDYPEWGGGD